MIYFDKDNGNLLHLFDASKADIMVILDVAQVISYDKGHDAMAGWLDEAKQDIVRGDNVDILVQNDDDIKLTHGYDNDELLISNCLGDVRVGVDGQYFMVFKGSDLSKYFVPLEDEAND